MIMGSVPWFVELGEFKIIKRCPVRARTGNLACVDEGVCWCSDL